MAELGRRFDKIVCTGVLHHLPDPQAGLRALREALKPGGAMHLMVYAPYGRAGIYMLQEYCSILGLGYSDGEIRDLAATLTALPLSHPLARLLGESPDFQTRAALADALLNPRDRAYTVLQALDLVESCGLVFGRWVRQAPYLLQCGSLATTPHAARLAGLPVREQHAAVELFRGNMLRHSLIAYRDDLPGGSDLPQFTDDGWPAYVPIRQSDTIRIQKRLPPGAAAVLINQAHGDPDLYLSVDAAELRLYDAIDGARTIREIIRRTARPASSASSSVDEQAARLFERLYWFDQVVFDTTLANKNSRSPVDPGLGHQ